MKQNQVNVRVLYADTDQMGVVYHAKYLEYFERGRTEFLRSFGYTYKELEATGIIMPVSDLSVKYLRPAYYDELLTVNVSLCENIKSKAVFTYEIKNEKEELLTTGTTSLPFVDTKSGRPCRPPKWFLEIFELN